MFEEILAQSWEMLLTCFLLLRWWSLSSCYCPSGCWSVGLNLCRCFRIHFPDHWCLSSSSLHRPAGRGPFVPFEQQEVSQIHYRFYLNLLHLWLTLSWSCVSFFFLSSVYFVFVYFVTVHHNNCKLWTNWTNFNKDFMCNNHSFYDVHHVSLLLTHLSSTMNHAWASLPRLQFIF